MTSVMTAFGTGIFSKRSVLSVFIVDTPSLHLANHNDGRLIPVLSLKNIFEEMKDDIWEEHNKDYS